MNPPKLWRSPLGKNWFIITVVLALGLTIFKIWSDLNFLPKIFETDKKPLHYDFFNLILYGAWIIGPPFFFLVEYTLIFGKDEARRMDPIQRDDLKYCHELASKVWAGVGVFLSILLFIKFGVKFW